MSYMSDIIGACHNSNCRISLFSYIVVDQWNAYFLYAMHSVHSIIHSHKAIVGIKTICISGVHCDKSNVCS